MSLFAPKIVCGKGTAQYGNVCVPAVKERLLLFDKELGRLIKTGWKHRIVYADRVKGIFVVEAEIPKNIMDEVHKQVGIKDAAVPQVGEVVDDVQ